MAKKEMNLTTKVYYECQIKPLQGVKNGWVDKLSTSTILNDWWINTTLNFKYYDRT